MVNYGEAIKRPFQDLKKLAIGLLLSIIPIVNFIAFGYILENTKSAMKKKYELTEWENWGDLFVKGLMFAVIGLIYAIPALIVFFLTIGVAAIKGMFTGQLAMSSIAALGVGFVIFGIIALITAYIVPSALMNYISKGKFAAAFELSTVTKKAFKGTYFAAWLVGFIYNCAVVFVLSWIPWIGTGLGSFMGTMTFYTLIAEAWAGK